MRRIRVICGILAATCAGAACISGGAGVRSPGPGPGPAEELAKRLRGRGLQVEYANPIEQPFFSVRGSVYTVDGADLQVFVYPAESAAGADAGRIAPSGRSVGTSAVAWIAPPHVFRKGPMIVIYLGSDARARRELAAQLGSQIAGAE